MQYTELINIGLKILAAIISIILTCKVKPWLEQKLGKEKLDQMIIIVKELVASAEQMLKSDDPTGEKRKAYVTQQLIAMGYKMTEQLNAIIESQVWTLNQEKKTVNAVVKQADCIQDK